MNNLGLLREWQKTLAECQERVDALTELTGMCPESPLSDAVSRMMAFATRATAQATGFDLDTLEAWWLEHDFGAKPMRAGIGDGPLRTIRTLKQLHDFLAELSA